MGARRAVSFLRVFGEADDSSGVDGAAEGLAVGPPPRLHQVLGGGRRPAPHRPRRRQARRRHPRTQYRHGPRHRGDLAFAGTGPGTFTHVDEALAGRLGALPGWHPFRRDHGSGVMVRRRSTVRFR